MLRKSMQWMTLSFALLLTSFAVNAQSTKALFSNSGDPVVGNPKGSVTVVEFFDYMCSHCASMAPTLSAVIKANPDVRFVFKALPVRGKASELAARSSLAAYKQGKYFQYSHALLNSDNSLTEESIMDIAKQSGLNMTKLKKDMDSSSVTNSLNNNLKLAEDLQLKGTPTFYIGKTSAKNINDFEVVIGEMSQSQMQTAIDKAKS